MTRNIIIKKGVLRTLSDREELMSILSELQEKFKTDRKIKVVLNEMPVKDEMIGYEEFVDGDSVEFCSIVEGSSEEFINLLLKEGGKKKLLESLGSFIKCKYVLYLSIKMENNYLKDESETKSLE